MKFRVSNQSWILLGTTIAIGIAFSVYFLVYVKNKEKKLVANNFRVLQQIVVNIGSLENSFYKNAIIRRASDEDADVNQDLLPKKKKQFPGDPVKVYENGFFLFYQEEGIYFLLDSIENEQEYITIPQDSVIFYSTDYQTFFNNELFHRSDVFDQIIITKENLTTKNNEFSKKVLYSNDQIGIMDSAFYKGTLQKAKSEININDKSYISFNQLINEEQKIYISALVLKSNFEQQKRSVSPFTVSFLSIILILIILSIPLLKLKIMNLEERLHLKDVVFSVFSLLIGPAVLIIFFYTLIAFISGKAVPEQIDSNLETLSKKLESNFSKELENMVLQAEYLNRLYHLKEHDTARTIAAEVDTSKLNRAFGDTTYFDTTGYKKREFYIYKDVLESNEFSLYRHQKSSFWADSEGFSRVVFSSFNKPSYGQNLSHRKYLMNIINEKPNHFSTQWGSYDIAIESIKSVNDGSYEVGVGIPTGCNQCQLPVFAISAKMSSVLDVVLEEGYGFCIIDAEGNTIFHSDKLKNLNENFIEETGGVFDHALDSKTQQTKTVDYNGKMQIIKLRPLDCLNDHYIATFVNSQVYYGPFTLSMISSFVFFLSFIVLLLLVYIIMFLFAYRPTKLKQMVYMFNFLKPYESKGHIKVYKSLVKLLLLLILYLFGSLLWNYSHYDFIIGEMVYFCVFLLLCIFIHLSRLLPKEEISHTLFQNLPATFLRICQLVFVGFFLIRATFFLFSDHPVPVMINAFAGVIIAIILAFNLLKVKLPAEKFDHSDYRGEEIRSLHSNFRWYVFLVVVLFSILPINLYLKITFNKEDEIFSKYRGLQLLERVENWDKINHEEFEGKFSPVTDSVFFISMKRDTAYLDYIISSEFHTKLLSENELEKEFIESVQDNRLYKTRVDDKVVYSAKESNEIFNGIYEQIRPVYNDRSKVTSNYLKNASSNPFWLYEEDKSCNIIRTVYYQPKNVLLNEVTIGKTKFFSTNWPYIVLIIGASLFFLYAFLGFMLNKIYGFSYRFYASKVGSINSTNFAEFFLNEKLFSNDSSYNNIFVVGVNIAHKYFIREAFKGGKKGRLFVLDLDDLFDRNEDVDGADSLNFMNIVKVRELIGDGKLEERKWLDLDRYYTGDDHAYVLIEHFEFGYNDLQVNKLKIKLLKYLVDCEKFKVIIKSEINATKLLDYYDDSIKRIEKQLQQKQQENAIELSEIMTDLKVDYKKWQHLLGSFVKCIIPINKLSDDHELKHGEFLDMLHKYMNPTGLFELPGDDKVLTIQQMSYPYYFSIWNSLSKTERYIVYDIAKDRFVNTVNANDIVSLLNKGILVYDHSLRLMNESFTNFVLTKVSSDEALEMEMKTRKKGTWNTAFGVIVLLVISLIIFLSIGQQNFLNDINAFITSIGALIGLLIRFSGLLSFGPNKAG